MTTSTLITNIGELVTLAPLANEQRFHNITVSDLGSLHQAWLLIQNGQVADYGTGTPPQSDYNQSLDAKGGLLIPGLIDAHTHSTYAGSRAHEFAMRLSGHTYQEIAAQGGGILTTVKACRAASCEELTLQTLKHFKRFLRYGVTSLETKSGYGLSVTEELKILQAVHEASAMTPQTIRATCLGLHAIPYDHSKERYIRDVINSLLPEVANQKLALWADAFLEQGYFNKSDIQPYFDKAKGLGLGIRLHADQFTDQNGGHLAAAYQAISADHLEYTNPDGIRAMADQGVVAVLLPATSLYAQIKYASATNFTSQGCPVAIATDFNPGSCQIENLAFTASLGALNCGLSPHEALAAITWVAAKATGLEQNKGCLAKGYDADFIIYDLPSVAAWIAFCGQELPWHVAIRGIEASGAD